MDFLQTLLSERDRLQETLKAINILINTYGTNERELVIKNDINASKISDESVFPVKARKDKQILWLFNNVIDKSLKISEVNEIYQKYSGNVDKVNNVARRLKESLKNSLGRLQILYLMMLKLVKLLKLLQLSLKVQ